jgi:hypothetical protein
MPGLYKGEEGFLAAFEMTESTSEKRRQGGRQAFGHMADHRCEEQWPATAGRPHRHCDNVCAAFRVPVRDRVPFGCAQGRRDDTHQVTHLRCL